MAEDFAINVDFAVYLGMPQLPEWEQVAPPGLQYCRRRLERRWELSSQGRRGSRLDSPTTGRPQRGRHRDGRATLRQCRPATADRAGLRARAADANPVNPFDP